MTTQTQVLLLNKNWQPVKVVGLSRAFGLLYAGAAKALDAQYTMYNFESWAELAAEYGDDTVCTAQRVLKVPRVLVLQAFDAVPRTHVRFSRSNIFLRDQNVCQYCGKVFPRTHLNLDHVIPKSRGGKASWTNIVCSCCKCNTKKDARTPAEAGMKLLRPPRKPSWAELSSAPRIGKVPYAEWLPFVDPVDAAYWNAEILP